MYVLVCVRVCVGSCVCDCTGIMFVWYILLLNVGQTQDAHVHLFVIQVGAHVRATKAAVLEREQKTSKSFTACNKDLCLCIPTGRCIFHGFIVL